MNEQQEKLSRFPFVIGGMSFIPAIGILFGFVAIIWGLTTKKSGGKKLALIGTGGIVFTVVLYSALFYVGFMQRGGVYDDLRTELSENAITTLVQAIEFYKTQNGAYPDSLKTLQESLAEDSMVFVFDPSDVKMGGQQRYFYYKLIDNEHYYLLGIGADEQPFTADDVLPKIEVTPNSKIGLVIKETKNNL
ncbi:MAG: type II secretion system protein G [Sulfuricurvum sp. PC08-66]|nr:MAG: type II secretion system protein G [Sulfuricurvum sp. PC08-66]